MDVLFTQSFAIMGGLAVIAGLARGLAGFGVGLIMMPVGAVLYSPQIMVPAIALIDIPVALYLMGQSWRLTNYKEVLPMSLVACIFIPLGIWSLLILDENVLAALVNLIVLFVAVILLTGVRFGGSSSRMRSISMGGVAGFLQGSVSLPGPPIILGWVAAQTPGPILRANIIFFFLFIDFVAVPIHWQAGLYTETTLWITAGFLPLFFGGAVLGQALHGKVPEEVFKRIVLGMVVVGAISGLGLSLLALL